MNTSLFALALQVRMAVVIAFLALVSTASMAEAQWTILVYMNGKNNLEPAALLNFHDMADVGSTDDVKIVVEMGRPKTVRYTHDDGDWTGVKRFLVKRNSSPVPGEALMDLEARGEPTDMGAPETLARFIDWGQKTFPAKHYMLVIWNHGQGWRYQLAATPEARVHAADGRPMPPAMASQNVRTVGGYRSVSQDEDSNHILYNRDIQSVLSDYFISSRKLDVLGFDACLMGMMETAYGFAPNVGIMVGSEELEPGDGWLYAPWLTYLTKNPSSSPEALAVAIVDAYAGRYGNRGVETLSVVRLSGIRSVAGQLSQLAQAISKQGASETSALMNARKQLVPYGRDVNLKSSIDLVTLLERYEKATSSAALRSQSQSVRTAIASQVAKNYASTRSANPNNDWLPRGSRGLAIYFPATKADYLSDPDHDGYLKTNSFKPVDFVKQESWADLLYVLLGI